MFLDDIQIASKRVRARDPVTSVDAAIRAQRFAASHANRILRALEGKSLSTHEIAGATGMHITQVARRTAELRSIGRIEVVQAGGEDLVRGGSRVWQLAEKNLASTEEKVCNQTSATV